MWEVYRRGQVEARERALDKLAAEHAEKQRADDWTLTIRVQPGDVDGLMRARRYVDALIGAAGGAVDGQEAPKTMGCYGCTFRPCGSKRCLDVETAAFNAFGDDCSTREVIYIRAEEK